MHSPSRCNLKWKAWIAICAILMQSLLPGFVYASTSKGGQFFEVCTALGSKTLAVGATDLQTQKQTPTQALHGGGHCVLCALAHAVALPPAESNFLPLPRVAPGVIADAGLLLQVSTSIYIPPPRGPPAFS